MTTATAERAVETLTAFFDTYASSAAIDVTLPDGPDGRGFDTYFSLDGVEIRDGVEVYADLGYTWYFSLRPTAVLIDEDLFAITIEGDDLRFASTTVLREYRHGWVRFYVSAGFRPAMDARSSRGNLLRALRDESSLSNDE